MRVRITLKHLESAINYRQTVNLGTEGPITIIDISGKTGFIVPGTLELILLFGIELLAVLLDNLVLLDVDGEDLALQLALDRQTVARQHGLRVEGWRMKDMQLSASVESLAAQVLAGHGPPVRLSEKP